MYEYFGNEHWEPIDESPQDTGEYLVIQAKDTIGIYRWVRTYIAGQGWQDIKEDKYGPVLLWNHLPKIPISLVNKLEKQ